MTSPTNRPASADDELAARLRATFVRAEALAAADPATRELATVALDRRARRRLPALSALAIAAVAIVIVVTAVSGWRVAIWTGRR